MRGAHPGVCAATQITQQNGQAVGHHHRAGLTGPSGVAGVGLRAVGGLKIQINQVCAVDLMQEYRSHLQPLLPLRPVVGHGPGSVANMLAQVETVPGRRRHPAQTSAA
jgi:hypothetical protein